MAPRGVLLCGAVFALSCLAFELERLGHACIRWKPTELSEPSWTSDVRL